MARLIEKKIETHKNIYTDSMENRTISVWIGVPDQAINENTNLLVISYGYNANYQSNIFKKLMQTLPDKYNLVVVCGCYFGSVFMSESNNFEPGKTSYFETDESEKEFNDMGIMQALDTVYMTLETLDFIDKKAQELKHIIIFGSSHGGYIAHLANLFCPGLYTYIVEISAYIFPWYLNHTREITWRNMSGDDVDIIVEYLVSHRDDLRFDKKVYDLKYLYKTADSNCRILSFQGKFDWMVDWKEKEIFINELV